MGNRRFCRSLLLGLFFFCVPAISSGEVSFDELFRQLIVGHWEQVSDVYAVSEFSAIMQYEANIYRSAQKRERVGHLKGVWRVENGQLQIRLTEALPPSPQLGLLISEKIVHIGARKLVLVDANGEYYTKLRVK